MSYNKSNAKKQEPDYSDLTLRKELEARFKDAGYFTEEESSAQPQMYEWQGEGCDDCRQYNGRKFSLDSIPDTHPNCKCELVADSNDNLPTIFAGEVQKERYEFLKKQEQFLLENMKQALLRSEGGKQYIYLDTKGFKTIGAGTKIDDKNTFMQINWQVNGRPATEAEKQQAFEIFELLKQKGKFGKEINAERYEDVSNLRIDEREISRLLEEHLRQDLKKLKSGFPNFDNLPLPLKEVLLDIRYNTGSVRRSNWPNLYEAIEKHDTAWTANEVNRKDIGKKRNNWAKEKVLSIRKW